MEPLPSEYAHSVCGECIFVFSIKHLQLTTCYSLTALEVFLETKPRVSDIFLGEAGRRIQLGDSKWSQLQIKLKTHATHLIFFLVSSSLCQWPLHLCPKIKG